jgi:DNA-directed RNA polymerase subunit RPC12/RpoP
MPSYNFLCKNKACGRDYEEFTSYDASGKYPKVKCPSCGSKKKAKLPPSSINFAFANPIGTDKWNSDSTGHDYRFKYNIPAVQAERQIAESLSHMGSDPYGDTARFDDSNLDVGIHDPEVRGGLI